MIDRLRIGTTLLATGLIAAAGLSLSTKSSAQGASAGSVELSAQQNNDKKNKKPPPKPVQIRPAPHANVQRGTAPHVNVQRRAPTHNVQQTVPNRNAPNRFVRPPNNGPKVVTPQNAGPKVINRTTTVRSTTTVRTFTPRGSFSRTVTASRLRGMPRTSVGYASIRGRNYSVWRRGYRVRYHGGYRTFIALTALTALAIAGSQYYPYAYIDAPQDYCDGLTPDGCQLVWEDVQTEEGDVIPQCVAYCPWQQ